SGAANGHCRLGSQVVHPTCCRPMASRPFRFVPAAPRPSPSPIRWVCTRRFAPLRYAVAAMYGDQLVRFEASVPHDGIREVLVSAGWLMPERAEHLAALGVTYLSGAHFEFELTARRRFISVDLDPDGSAWLLRIRAYELVRARGEVFGARGFFRQGL